MSIPVLDLQPWFHGNAADRERLSLELRHICHEIGFFYIVGHGIPRSVGVNYMAMLKAFFALPLEVRQAIDKAHSPQFRGWERLGSELTNNQVDYREQLDIGVEREIVPDPDPYYLALLGPNQWPPPEALPGFRECIDDYFARLSAVARELLNMMSLALGLEAGFIEKVFGANPSPYLKLIRYPPTASGEHGVGVHKDSGFLTLLLQDDSGGLEALGNDDRWYRVDPLADSLVVNTGELLQLTTHNYFIATPHRVINRGDGERFSSAFFYSPDLGTRLEPMPVAPELIDAARQSLRHRGEGLMASRAEMARGTAGMASQFRPTVFGEKYWQRWVRSYPEIARRFYPDRME